MESNFEFNLPVSVYFGNDSIKKIPTVAKTFGSNCLLVTSKDISTIEDKIELLLTKSDFIVEKFYLESPEPTTSFIDSSITKLSSKHFDFIIGVGGGSSIDLAKCLSIALTNKKPIWMYANLSYQHPHDIENPTIPIIAVPTTAGTGSEVTPYAVLDNNDIKQKGTIQNALIFPKAAFVDPNLTLEMPTELTISTGLDTFSHALESYINTSKNSPISEILAEKTIRLIFNNLPKVIYEPTNLELRSSMALASTFAGIAIANRGTTSIHAIAEPLGALTHIPHGHCVGISILPTLKKTWKYAIDKFATLYDLLFDLLNIDKEKKAKLFVDKVDELLSSLQMKRNVSYYLPNVEKEKLEESLLENITKYKFRPLKHHPVEFSNEDLRFIIAEIIGKR